MPSTTQQPGRPTRVAEGSAEYKRTAAILDRLLDGAAVINIKGPSWRLREHQALTQPLAQLNDPPEPPSRTRR